MEQMDEYGDDYIHNSALEEHEKYNRLVDKVNNLEKCMKQHCPNCKDKLICLTRNIK